MIEKKEKVVHAFKKTISYIQSVNLIENEFNSFECEFKFSFSSIIEINVKI